MGLKAYMINEKYKNLFNDNEKQEYKQEVFDLLHKAYEKVEGGLAGSGFGSPDEMVKKIKMWKLVFKKGKLVTVAMYKDKFGRKLVAFGTAGRDGLKPLGEIIEEDFKRAYVELSGPALNWIENWYGKLLKKYQIPAKEAVGVLNLMPSEYKIYNEFKYQREIGGEWHTKLMAGTPGKDIINYN